MSRKKSTELKLLEGNPGKKKLPYKKPRQRGQYNCPKYLKGHARRLWRKVMNHTGLTHPLDTSLLEAYCTQYQLYRDALEHVETFGNIIMQDNGVQKKNPSLGVVKDAAVLMQQLHVQLQLDAVMDSPVNDGVKKNVNVTKTGTDADDGDGDSDLEDFFK